MLKLIKNYKTYRRKRYVLKQIKSLKEKDLSTHTISLQTRVKPYYEWLKAYYNLVSDPSRNIYLKLRPKDVVLTMWYPNVAQLGDALHDGSNMFRGIKPLSSKPIKPVNVTMSSYFINDYQVDLTWSRVNRILDTAGYYFMEDLFTNTDEYDSTPVMANRLAIMDLVTLLQSLIDIN